MGEIKTCEQYVLYQLSEQRDENDRLAAENGRLREELAEATKEPEPIARRVAEIGHKLVFNRWFYEVSLKNVDSFEEFCHKSLLAYALPDDISESEAVRFFEPELRERWERVQAERKAEEEDAE